MVRLVASATIVLSAVVAPLVAGDGDWPQWRGPAADGMARGDAPVRWSTTEGIAWKTGVPGRGLSSPVIWGNQIFLTTAVPTSDPVPGSNAIPEHRFLVLAYDRRDGKLLWERVATVATPHERHHQQYGSFASNSPVTDGTHLFAFFGSRGLYAYTLQGGLVWQKDFGPLNMYNDFGEGAWTALDSNTLFVVLDHEGESFLIALDKSTGRELWRTPREGNTNWSGPFVTTQAGGKQVIVSASREVVGYDAATGTRIWSARGLGQNTIPAPVASDGMVFVMSGFRNPNLMAIRLGREGDLTGSDAIVWQNQRGNSYTASPVLYEGKLYVLTDSGMLSAFDARSGTPFYQQARLPKPYNFKASPVGANGKLYLASEEGDVIVAKMGESFEVLATNSIAGESFLATPAIMNGEILLRGRSTLYSIR
jgi:outer membrane protein assembly factor BamB